MPQQTAAGLTGTAAITPRSGAVCLRAELPAGVLQNAVATLPWEMADDEKLFMNGYQTWTACPELGKWDPAARC